jgi:hypothetical protein
MTFEKTIPRAAVACVSGKTAAQASPLPGETAVRKDLIESAVHEINRLYVSKGLEAARGIGEFVLRTFFDGRTQDFHKRGKKHVSFRKLAEQDGLRVSYGFIWKCVAFVDQLKTLPDDLASALPVTHHTLLLPVHDERTKVTLARKAVRENLSKRELAAEVGRIRRQKPDGGAKRGRPPTPPVERVISLLGRVAAEAASHGTKADLDHLDGDRMRTLMADAEKHIEVLRGLVERLRATVAATPAQVAGGHGTI